MLTKGWYPSFTGSLAQRMSQEREPGQRPFDFHQQIAPLPDRLCAAYSGKEIEETSAKKQEDGTLSTHSHDMLHNTESLPKDASEYHVV